MGILIVAAMRLCQLFLVMVEEALTAFPEPEDKRLRLPSLLVGGLSAALAVCLLPLMPVVGFSLVLLRLVEAVRFSLFGGDPTPFPTRDDLVSSDQAESFCYSFEADDRRYADWLAIGVCVVWGVGLVSPGIFFISLWLVHRHIRRLELD